MNICITLKTGETLNYFDVNKIEQQTRIGRDGARFVEYKRLRIMYKSTSEDRRRRGAFIKDMEIKSIDVFL